MNLLDGLALAVLYNTEISAAKKMELLNFIEQKQREQEEAAHRRRLLRHAHPAYWRVKRGVVYTTK